MGGDFDGDPVKFPISRDPPEGGTSAEKSGRLSNLLFPISRDPPEGGTGSIITSLLQG